MKSILESVKARIFLIVVIVTMVFSTVASASISPVEILVQAKTWIVLLILIWEYLVGKTRIVKSNSTIELIIAGVKKMLGITDSDLKV